MPTMARLVFRMKGPEVDFGTLMADPRSTVSVLRHAGVVAVKVDYFTRMSRAALQRLESQRDGAPIDVELWADARAFVGGGKEGRAGAMVAQRCILRHFDKVSADDWHSLIKSAGVTSSIILEIPVPSEAEFPELAAALAHLRRSIDERGRGDNAHAITSCRIALDELEQRGFGGHAPKEVVAFLKQGVAKMTLSERFSMVQAALVGALSPAAHAGQLRVDLGRPDSQFAVTAVAALLALAPYRGRREVPDPPDQTPDEKR